MATRSMISFDWALKRLLCNKANFGVLEGFLSELLRRKIVVKSIVESESNQQHEDDKFNKVDLLVENDTQELIIIELQFYSYSSYFHRMLYGVSKSITEYISMGEDYENIRKVYSVNIVYFDLGKGDDYIYHGSTNFVGLHTHEELQLSEKQRSVYNKNTIADLFPEYYILKVQNFNDVAKDTLDEWMYYLKNNKIKDDFTAQGLDQARKVLVYDNLSDEEKWRYENEIKITRIKNGEIKTAFMDGEYKKAIQIAKNLKAAGVAIDIIANTTGLTIEQIEKI
ncbi:MAG: Rpn family recombination-promoting nuclease/putative transposase [Bacteroidetes bacterium]|nr:Rpn family recombination-promoting nuclease/putative transposase [Bacteroidota bacterium]